MCLILFSINSHPQLPLVIAANRDEFYHRPTLSADYWEDYPQVLGGKDLEAGGTWLGITKSGRFAALTNFRSPNRRNIKRAKSRGELVHTFLSSETKISALEHAKNVISRGSDYEGFNLLLSDGQNFIYCNNQTNEIKSLSSGTFALSNHLLDTPWPKALTGKQGLIKLINNTEKQIDKKETEKLAADLFKLLQNKKKADDDSLPQTGIDKNMEKLLSSLFIESELYGTCCSTAIIFDNKREVYFHEKQYYSAEHKKEHLLFLDKQNLKIPHKQTLNTLNDNIFYFPLEQ